MYVMFQVNEMIPQKSCQYMPKQICHTRKRSSLSSNEEITSSIKSFHVLEEQENTNKRENLETNLREPRQLIEHEYGLPEHLKNFKEFHSLPPPISSELTILNRRIKRNAR